jgi:hypothetical protein
MVKSIHDICCCTTEHLDDEEFDLLARLKLIEAKGDDKLLSEMMEDIRNTGLSAIMMNRLEIADDISKYSVPLLAWVAMRCENPAEAVMWAYDLYRMEGYTLDDWARRWPEGFPTRESVKNYYYDNLKRPGLSTNVLDLKESWE